MKKKLLIPTDTFLPKLDGSTSFVKNIIPRLAEYYDITVACPDFGEINRKIDARLVRFKPMNFKLGDISPCFPNLFTLDTEIKKADIIWIQGGFGFIGLWSAILAKKHKKRTALMTHIIEWDVFPKSLGNKYLASPINTATLAVARKLYNLCEIVMVPSVEVAELLSLHGFTSKKKIIRLGVDSVKFMPPVSKEKAKEALGLDPRKYTIGYIGRLALEKDLKTLFRAFKRLSSIHEDSFLVIVGDGRDDVKKLFIDKPNIKYFGPQSDVVPYFQALDVHVLPSLIETANLATLEAMSCGLAVAATPVGYIKEYIQDKFNGLIFKKKDSYMLFRRLEVLRSQAIRAELGKNARETVLQNFSIEKTLSDILETLQKLHS
ncbi:MAG: glycosyltransferase family 4 protein [archaeon]